MKFVYLLLSLLFAGSLHAGTSTDNLLLDPGFESGTNSVWKAGGPVPPIIVSTNTIPAAHNDGFQPFGNFFATGGRDGSGYLEQITFIQGVRGITTAQIDSGLLTANVGFKEASFDQNGIDTARLTLIFLTATGQEANVVIFDEIAAPNPHTMTPTWTNFIGSASIPAGTRSIKYKLDFILHSGLGSDLDAFVDDTFLTISDSQENASIRFFEIANVTEAGVNGTIGAVNVNIEGRVTGNNPANEYDGFSVDYFSPAVSNIDYLEISASTTGDAFTISFSRPVANPILHLKSLASELTFSKGTPIRVSGDNTFTVNGPVVKGTRNDDPNGLDSNGTIAFRETISTISFSGVYDGTPGNPSDGITLQIGIPTQGPIITARLAIELTFPTVSGQKYQLQYSHFASPSEWISIDPVFVGDGSTTSIFKKTDDAQQRYFRLLLVD